MLRSALTAATFANSVLMTLALIGFFTLIRETRWFVVVFFSAAILNALLFLYFTRHRRLNAKLTETQKNRWEIGLFLASPVTFPLYLFRYVLPTHEAA